MYCFSSGGYHWDTSDWNPTNPLRKIATVPSKKKGSSSLRRRDSRRSRDSNLHICNDEVSLHDAGHLWGKDTKETLR